MQDKQVIGEAIRIEHDQKANKVYIVFEILSEDFKKKVVKTWNTDIEYEIINKNLVY